jgi:hypothetical protein
LDFTLLSKHLTQNSHLHFEVILITTSTLLVANKKPNVRDVMEDDHEATTDMVPR